jgi:hypothetical protein
MTTYVQWVLQITFRYLQYFCSAVQKAKWQEIIVFLSSDQV